MGYEQQMKEYEGTKTKKEEEMKTAQEEFNKADDGLKKFKEDSSKHMSDSIGSTLNVAVGQMISQGRNGSLEAKMLLRDLDNLATKIGVSKQELKNVFAANPQLREKMGNTAIGGYVNSQIANAMGSVCEYQAMCAVKDAANAKKFKPEIVRRSMEHLNDKNRGADVVKSIGEEVGRDMA